MIFHSEVTDGIFHRIVLNLEECDWALVVSLAQ